MKMVIGIAVLSTVIVSIASFIAGYQWGLHKSQDLYNAKISSWVAPYDQTKHKAPYYDLMGKG